MVVLLVEEPQACKLQVLVPALALLLLLLLLLLVLLLLQLAILPSRMLAALSSTPHMLT
jgi:hypothetical protein